MAYAYEINKRISQFLLRPAHVLANVVRAGEGSILIRHSASVSKQFDCQHSVADASDEVDGQSYEEPGGKLTIVCH